MMEIITWWDLRFHDNQRQQSDHWQYQHVRFHESLISLQSAHEPNFYMVKHLKIFKFKCQRVIYIFITIICQGIVSYKSKRQLMTNTYTHTEISLIKFPLRQYLNN